MPRVGSFGSASARAFAAGGILPQATFRSITRNNNTGPFSNVNKPAGIAVGDIVLIFADRGGSGGATTITTSGGGTWTKLAAAGGYTAVFWKVLDATDVSNSWGSLPDGYCTTIAYIPNGATGVDLTTYSAVPTAGVLTIPGVSRFGSRGIVTLLSNKSTGPSGVVPTSFTDRQAVATWGSGVADLLTGAYAGGNVVWTGLPAASQDSFLVKFT